MNNLKNKSIILFDGVCNLCNASVHFIIKHDKKERYLFASLQSDAAKEILLQFPEKKIEISSVLLVEDNRIYEKSTAALRIAKHLNGCITYLSYARYLPLFIRDGIYAIIAANRYQVFGKSTDCRIPTPQLKKRFL